MAMTMAARASPRKGRNDGERQQQGVERILGAIDKFLCAIWFSPKRFKPPGGFGLVEAGIGAAEVGECRGRIARARR